MSPSLTMCTQLRTLRTGSYAPDYSDICSSFFAFSWTHTFILNTKTNSSQHSNSSRRSQLLSFLSLVRINFFSCTFYWIPNTTCIQILHIFSHYLFYNSWYCPEQIMRRLFTFWGVRSIRVNASYWLHYIRSLLYPVLPRSSYTQCRLLTSF